jgi:hypothetical protein
MHTMNKYLSLMQSLMVKTCRNNYFYEETPNIKRRRGKKGRYLHMRF